jgi:hypothetical protein
MRTTLKTLAALLTLALAPLAAFAGTTLTISSAIAAAPAQGSLNLNITVTGTGYTLKNPITTVYLNSVAVPTTFVSSTELTATWTMPEGTSAATVTVKAPGDTAASAALTFSKKPIEGLVTQGEEDNADSATFDYSMNQLCDFGNISAAQAAPCATQTGSVPWAAADVSIGWNQLQSTEGGAISTTYIEDALSAITSFNNKHGVHVTAKLRIFSGTHAPTWATSGAYPSWKQGVTLITDPTSANKYATFPEFWTTGYHSDWQDLLSKVAAVYDNDPRVQEIAVTSCSGETGEPFIYQYNDTASENALLGINGQPALGDAFSDQQMQTCLGAAASDFTTNWVQTPIDFTFSPYDCLGSASSCAGVNNGGAQGDVSGYDFGLNLMQEFHASTSATNAVIANHDAYTDTTSQIYFGDSKDGFSAANNYGLQAEGKNLAAPIELQSISNVPAGENGNGTGWQNTMLFSLCNFAVTEFELFPSTRVTFNQPPNPMKSGLSAYTTGSLYNSGGNPVGLSDWAGWMAAGIPGSIPAGDCSASYY